MATIYKGDNTGSFGNNFLTIRATIPTGYTVAKADVKIGNLPVIHFSDPTFPLVINLDSSQTKQLQQQNPIYLAVYDSQGRKATCKGTITFVARDEVVR